ncbi:hypothetical protein KM043_013505 [Ampulex compressa]|nr:hypothetical protein KM043_013505 [Ampulex compressa]
MPAVDHCTPTEYALSRPSGTRPSRCESKRLGRRQCTPQRIAANRAGACSPRCVKDDAVSAPESTSNLPRTFGSSLRISPRVKRPRVHGSVSLTRRLPRALGDFEGDREKENQLTFPPPFNGRKARQIMPCRPKEEDPA